jgi:serine protease AprX
MSQSAAALGVLVAILLVAVPTHRIAPSLASMDAAVQRLVGGRSLPDGRNASAVRVIVQTADAASSASIASIEQAVTTMGGRVGRRLAGHTSVVAEVSASQLPTLVRHPSVRAVSLDRRLHGTLEKTAATIGARWVNQNLGFEGAGIGIAIIDSGVSQIHDDLGDNRVVHFVDFVSQQTQPHDPYGHGTHVAGIIGGSGHDSNGTRRGIAPGAHLMVLKTLNELGEGFISDAIAALDYAIERRKAFNIRVINLSVAAGVYESYRTDPLALAAARAVDAGIVVVTAAGNQGRNAKGQQQYGGITAPGNAPWVLTVGAASHNGTLDRADDTIAPFSSVGPSAIDLVPKPDLVAPGVGIEAPADSDSTLFVSRPDARVWGTVTTLTEPYLSLSGTSMAAPVVAGTVALMVEANPMLKPQAIKAILQASARVHPSYSHLAQGAGFLDTRGAVQMAQTFASNPAAAARLGRFVRTYEARQGRWVVPCNSASGAGCVKLLDPCATTVGCAEHVTGAIVGTTTPAASSVVWRPAGGGRPSSSGPAATIVAKPGVFE